MSEQEPIRRVLGIIAHPDDPEFFCGATFARWSAEGVEVTFVLATSGDKGSSDPEMTHERLATIREEEERNAAAALGVKEVIFLRYPDGELMPSLDLRRDVTRLIRMKKPDAVVTCDPTVFWWGEGAINHPDHRAIGQAALDAVYPTARDRLNFIELERYEGLDTHKTRWVYISGTANPNKKVDVSAYIETQVAALREHKSQISDMDGLLDRMRQWRRDPESPDDAPRYVESFRVMKLG
ncbi:MAG: PIG-L family deacetylase [Anaerolineae bacterium]|nr:PIG-L family deacetylase [Anaerolineae bacterium]